jgi:hypothetical protein
MASTLCYSVIWWHYYWYCDRYNFVEGLSVGILVIMRGRQTEGVQEYSIRSQSRPNPYHMQDFG